MSNPLSSTQLQALIQQHASGLELYARQWTAHPEDCVQDAFVRLIESTVTIENHRAWLFQVVRNLAIDMGRAESSRRRRESKVANNDAVFEPDESNEIDTKQLQLALAELGDEEREVIVSKIWGNLTFEEIAELSNTSITTAHRRFTSGLKKLKSKLSQYA